MNELSLKIEFMIKKNSLLWKAHHLSLTMILNILIELNNLYKI